MDIKPLEIKNKTDYSIDNISYIDDFDVNSLKVTKKESRIGVNIYYTRCDLNLDEDTTIPLYFLIDDLIGYIEEIDGSSDKYLIIASSLRNKNIISDFDTIWRSIENKINPGIKIKDYNKWTTSESEKTGLYGNIYDFVVDYKPIHGVRPIYDMHRYLMTKHNISRA